MQDCSNSSALALELLQSCIKPSISFLNIEMLQLLEFMKKYIQITEYRQVSNIRRTLIGNKIVDHSDIVGASPVGAAPTTSSFST